MEFLILLVIALPLALYLAAKTERSPGCADILALLGLGVIIVVLFLTC
jgi:hypothetical protein